jgi:SAM-dependent methyltransferase
MTVDFDTYAAGYRETVERSTSFSGRDLDFFTAVKVRLLLELVSRRVGRPSACALLDVGCGTGATDALLLPHVGSLDGVDVSEEMVSLAGCRNPSGRYRAYDGHRLPFEDGSFDVVFAICVLHHVPPEEWDSLVAEMLRATRAGGLACVFEHNPFNPLTRRAVGTCDFDRDAVLLPMRRTVATFARAGAVIEDRRYFLFTPFESRPAALCERLLRRLPMGGQYLVAARPRMLARLGAERSVCARNTPNVGGCPVIRRKGGAGALVRRQCLVRAPVPSAACH